jgi:hypothetical protein
VLTIDVLVIDHLYRNHDVNLDYTVEVHPEVPIQLSVERPDELTSRFDFTHLLDSDDPLVALARALADILGIPIESMLYQLAGSAAVGVLGTPDNQCKQPTPGHVECRYQIRVPSGAPLQTVVTRLIAFEDGMTIGGTLRVTELTHAIIQAAVHEFKIGVPPVHCGAAGMALAALFQQDPSAFAVLHAFAYIENQGTAPLNLCAAPGVVTDPAGAFPAGDVRTDGTQATFQIFIDIAAPSPTYYANRYPLDLVVKTSGGTRLLRFAPPPTLSREDYDRLGALMIAAIGNCEQQVSPWFNSHQGYNPGWSPRSPENARVEHLWQVAIDGLPAGEAAALVDAQGHELMRARGTGAPVRLSTVIQPGGERELSIVHIGGRSGAARPTGKNARGIEVRQTLLVHLGSIPLSADCRTLMVTRRMTGPRLLAMLDGQIAAFDVARPDRPQRIRSWTCAGVRGAIDWQDGLLAYGVDGVEWLDGWGKQGGAAPGCDLTSVPAAAADEGALYTVSDGHLSVYSRKLCRIAQIPIKGATSLLRTGTMLVAGGREGLAVVDVSNPRQPEPVATVRDLWVVTLASVPAGEPGAFVAVTDNGAARVFQLVKRQADEIARYPAAPWYAGAARIGGVLVKISADRRSLDLYRLGPSAIA